MVIDSSVLLAILFEEKHDNWAKGMLAEHVADLTMSTVNLTEVLILVKSRRPNIYEATKAELWQL